MRPTRVVSALPASRPANAVDRRRFVAWFGASLLLSACGKGPQSLLAPGGTSVPRTGRPIVNVKEAGARGDGAADDTGAINAAVAALGSEGGTVWLPAGLYLIDPTKSIRLTGNVTLMLDPAATLQALAVTLGYSAIVTASGVNNIGVIGGQIVGERVGHLGTTGEWGMGIRIMGCSNVRIDSVQISDCWGDGIYIGAAGVGKESQNVIVNKCVARNNRRQGLSITGCRGATIRDSQFTDTNGTMPSSGIDLEPNNALHVVDVMIDNCFIARNAGHGLLLVGAAVRNAQIVRNKIVANGFAGTTFLRGVNQCHFSGNAIERNADNGVLIDSGFANEIIGNDIHRNSRRAPGQHPNILIRNGSAHNTVAQNRFGSVRRLLQNAGRDIVVTDDCHDNTFELATPVDSAGKRRP